MQKAGGADHQGQRHIGRGGRRRGQAAAGGRAGSARRRGWIPRACRHGNGRAGRKQGRVEKARKLRRRMDRRDRESPFRRRFGGAVQSASTENTAVETGHKVVIHNRMPAVAWRAIANA